MGTSSRLPLRSQAHPANQVGRFKTSVAEFAKHSNELPAMKTAVVHHMKEHIDGQVVERLARSVFVRDSGMQKLFSLRCHKLLEFHTRLSVAIQQLLHRAIELAVGPLPVFQAFAPQAHQPKGFGIANVQHRFLQRREAAFHLSVKMFFVHCAHKFSKFAVGPNVVLQVAVNVVCHKIY